ncbi:hypothetical protein, partial [Streptomyces sp.]|uniref:hypothetical protein n=1 Tax=Streptomyces sp. TaxID=1931 RepID=UPI002D62DA0C
MDVADGERAIAKGRADRLIHPDLGAERPMPLDHKSESCRGLLRPTVRPTPSTRRVWKPWGRPHRLLQR